MCGKKKPDSITHNASKRTTERAYPRIQVKGKGYDPEHKSYRPPKDWEVGMYMEPTKGTITSGMAAFHALPNTELMKALDGKDFIITTKEKTPFAMDWEKAGTETFTRNDALRGGYDVFLIYGKEIEVLPDGVIITPERIPDDWVKRLGLPSEYNDATTEERELGKGLIWSWT